MTATHTQASAAPAASPAGTGPPAPVPNGTAAGTGSDFMRISVAGSAGRADLAVPAALPLARLLPELLRHAGEEPGTDGGVRHGGWVLCRVDATRLDPAAGLAAQGVREGELLFVRHGTADTTPPLYDDVVEVITEHGSGAGWTARATRAVTAVLAAFAVLACCAALAAAPGRLPGGLGLGVAAFALAVAVLMSRAFGDVPAGTFAAVLAAPPAMLGAVLLLGGEGWGAGHLLMACVVLAVAGTLGPLLVGGGDGTFTALVTAGILAGIGAGICGIWGVAPDRAAAVTGPLALALTTVLPTVALRIARTPAPYVAGSAEDLEALPSQLEHAALRGRVARARKLLIGLVAGCQLVAGGATVVLFAAGELWPAVTGTALVLLILLRARLFKDAAQALIPLSTAVLATAGAVVFTVLRLSGDTVWLLGAMVPGAVLVALISGLVGLFAGRQRVNPRASRALDMLETTVLLSVVPLVLAVWGVYSTLLNFKV
jgi:type VII secretion integral membrane protein EccD